MVHGSLIIGVCPKRSTALLDRRLKLPVAKITVLSKSCAAVNWDSTAEPVWRRRSPPCSLAIYRVVLRQSLGQQVLRKGVLGMPLGFGPENYRGPQVSLLRVQHPSAAAEKGRWGSSWLACSKSAVARSNFESSPYRIPLAR